MSNFYICTKNVPPYNIYGAFMYRRRLQAKLTEAEQNMESAYSKCHSLEKVKCRLQGELEDLMVDVERVRVSISVWH